MKSPRFWTKYPTLGPLLTIVVILPFAAIFSAIVGVYAVAPAAYFVGERLSFIDNQSSRYCNQTAELWGPAYGMPLVVSTFLLMCMVPAFRRFLRPKHPLAVCVLIWLASLALGVWFYYLDTHNPSLCSHSPV